MESLYDQDFYEWTQKTAALLREGRFGEVDMDHVAEELEAMGKSERRELISRLSVLLMHLIKWEYQPERRSKSWQSTIIEQRTELMLLFQDSPSLRQARHQALGQAYRLAVIRFEKETGLGKETVPADCPYSFDQAMDPDFLPEQATSWAQDRMPS